jgi:hypothetical protein
LKFDGAADTRRTRCAASGAHLPLTQPLPAFHFLRGFLGSIRQRLLLFGCATIFQPGAREIAMAKGQMRSNKEKKKPKANKNTKKGGATPSPFSSGKTPAGQSPNSKK